MSELFYLTQYKKTTLNVAGGINDTQTTGIVLQNVDGVDKTKPGIVAISYDEPLDTSQVEFITYTSINASNELQGVTRGAEGFSAKSHVNGATVAFILSKSHLNNLIDAYKAEHNTDGTHSDMTADTITTSGLADLNSLKIASGSTQITSILDEDDLGSNSATALATQQSIKAYVDSIKPELHTAYGVTFGPTTSSTSWATIPEMTITFTPKISGDVYAELSMEIIESTTSYSTQVKLTKNGGELAASYRDVSTLVANKGILFNTVGFTSVTAGTSYTFKAEWKVSNSTLTATAYSTKRSLAVMVFPT